MGVTIVLMNISCSLRIEVGNEFCSFCVLLILSGIECHVLLSDVV